MNSSFEITKVRDNLYCARAIGAPSYFNAGLYFTKQQVSDLVHQLMYYIPTEEAK